MIILLLTIITKLKNLLDKYNKIKEFAKHSFDSKQNDLKG